MSRFKCENGTDCGANGYCDACPFKQIRALQADNDRLDSLAEDYKTQCELLSEDNTKLQAENERLANELASANRRLDVAQGLLRNRDKPVLAGNENYTELQEQSIAYWKALDKAAAALLQIKRMGVSNDVMKFCSDHYEIACRVLNQNTEIDGPEFGDGYAHEGFPGGCERMQCPDYIKLQEQVRVYRESLDHDLVNKYLEDYELRDDNACYTPNDFEKTLILDFVMGLYDYAEQAINQDWLDQDALKRNIMKYGVGQDTERKECGECIHVQSINDDMSWYCHFHNKQTYEHECCDHYSSMTGSPEETTHD